MTGRRTYVLYRKGCDHPVVGGHNRGEVERTAAALRLAGYSQWRVRLATRDEVRDDAPCPVCQPEIDEWLRKVNGDEVSA